MKRKVTVVGGAGNVGQTCARVIAERNLADVVIIDIAKACAVVGSDSKVVGGDDYSMSAGSDVVVITSGMQRKPGMSRDDLVQTNYNIMKAVTEQVVRYSPDCIILPVANPLDAMCQAVYRLTKFPRERVIGMAGVLDSARMRTFLAMELNVSVQDVSVFVLGGHGDEMVPLAGYSTIGGVPLTEM